MPPKPLPKNTLPAYYHAAQAVVAVQFGIKVRSVSILPDWAGRTHTRLASVRESCVLEKPNPKWVSKFVERYVMTLLAGIVGRQIRVERHFGFLGRSTGQVRLDNQYRAKLRKCEEPDLGTAFGLAFGWLEASDDGDTINTLERLRWEVREMFQIDADRQRLDRLANRLIELGEMSGAEIVELVV